MDSFGNLLHELKRRRVFRVAAAYAVVAWFVIQVAEIAFGAFELPAGAMRIVIILALVGFPVAVALAWAFDITSTGVERAGAADAHAETGAATSTSRPRKLVAGGVIVAGLAAAVLTVLGTAPEGAPVMEGDPRQSVIVFPFENVTSVEELDYLEDGAMNLLSLALTHWDDMRVFDDERTASLLRRRDVTNASDLDLDTAIEMARQAAVGTFVLGELRLEGDSLAIETKIYDTQSGDRLTTEVARVIRSGDPRAPFNTLAAEILQISGAPPGERPDLLAQTTRSLEAYRAYLDGTRAFQQFQTDSANAHLLRAVALDSTFALAYLRLRDVDGWAGIEADPRRRREWIAKAVAHSEGLPPRYASLVRFHEAYESGRLQQARAVAEQMIARDSTDVEAWYQLGEAHFHHSPGRVPHADSLGDMQSALSAFQRTLELDPAYVLAYQHVIDVLASCAADAPWLCLDDRTVYAARADLVDEFGAEAIADRRAQFARDRLAASYEWVSASPRSERAHNMLLQGLLSQDRTDEAARHIETLRARGLVTLATVWDGRRALVSADYGAAADNVASLMSESQNLRDALASDPEWMLGALYGGARRDLTAQALQGVLAMVPVDTIVGPDNIAWSKALFEQFQMVNVDAMLGQRIDLLAGETHAYLDALDASYEPGTPAHETHWLTSGSAVLAAYLATGEGTLLSRFVAVAATTQSRTWRTMDAFLALERGDTTTARAALQTHFLDRDGVEISGDPGAVRLFSWAVLQERLGDLDDALASFALFDTEASFDLYTVLHVRSWYERGRLLQALGQPERAGEQYQRFVSAWSGGDDIVQPLVAQVAATLAELDTGS